MMTDKNMDPLKKKKVRKQNIDLIRANGQVETSKRRK